MKGVFLSGCVQAIVQFVLKLTPVQVSEKIPFFEEAV
jgi:hypothetical protein